MRKINVKTPITGLQISGCAGSVRNGNVRSRNVGGCGWVISRRQIERKKRPIPIMGMLRDIHLCPIIIKYHTASFARRRQRGYQIKLASETLYIYAPLSHRIGLYNIKTELEDLSFKYTEYDRYVFIKNKIEDSKEEQDQYIKSFSEIIKFALAEEKLKY